MFISIPTHIIDAVYRVAYRLAYPCWQLYLRQFRHRTQGAQVAVWNRDRVLLIRNSYRQRYSFPGGYIHGGEHTASAACRELREETGISVPTEHLVFSFAWTYTSGKLVARDDIYVCKLQTRPTLSIDNREVIEARFMSPDKALGLPLEAHVRHYLTQDH